MPGAGFDADRTRYLQLLLTDGVHALNLCSDIGRSLIDRRPRNHVALALHAGLLLLAVAYGEDLRLSFRRGADKSPMTARRVESRARHAAQPSGASAALTASLDFCRL